MNFKPNYKLDLQMFAEDTPPEEKEPKKPAEPEDKEINAVKALKELKANTVSKKEYVAVVKQNKELLGIVLNGDEDKFKQQDKKSKVERMQTLREELYGPKRNRRMTNLDCVSKTLELRDLLIESGEVDPMIPQGGAVSATSQDYISAENVASGLKKLVEEAKGNPNVFNDLLEEAGLGKSKLIRRA